MRTVKLCAMPSSDIGKAMAPPETSVRLCLGCDAQPPAEPHECPYALEINSDSETLCDCCKDCEGTCADDI